MSGRMFMKTGRAARAAVGEGRTAHQPQDGGALGL